MLAYTRHFIFAGCYDNNPWYLLTNLAGFLNLVGFLNLAGHLDLEGFYFSICPANDRESPSLNIMDLPGLEYAPPLKHINLLTVGRK